MQTAQSLLTRPHRHGYADTTRNLCHKTLPTRPRPFDLLAGACPGHRLATRAASRTRWVRLGSSARHIDRFARGAGCVWRGSLGAWCRCLVYVGVFRSGDFISWGKEAGIFNGPIKMAVIYFRVGMFYGCYSNCNSCASQSTWWKPYQDVAGLLETYSMLPSVVMLILLLLAFLMLMLFAKLINNVLTCDGKCWCCFKNAKYFIWYFFLLKMLGPEEGTICRRRCRPWS